MSTSFDDSNSAPAIRFHGVTFSFAPGRETLHDLSLEVNSGETLVLLGASGSGKTTALRLINRLIVPSSGDVLVQGKSTLQWDVIRLRRSIGYVIQEIGLFPHYTIARNIGVVPEIEDWPAGKIATRTSELLHLVGLDEDLASRYPAELSGGQRQRVGVARALAADPPILLMDEPFGALDPLTRDQLQRDFRELQTRLHKTVVFVTHDMREAMLLGDRIALMDHGKIATLLTPREFLRSEHALVAAYRNAFTADLPLWQGAA
jgi:osmoprotectant transport system ATP-binding protein